MGRGSSGSGCSLEAYSEFLAFAADVELVANFLPSFAGLSVGNTHQLRQITVRHWIAGTLQGFDNRVKLDDI